MMMIMMMMMMMIIVMIRMKRMIQVYGLTWGMGHRPYANVI